MYCPVCNSHNTGKTGSCMYFCSNCLLEFTVQEDAPQIFYMDPEGNPVTITDKETASKLAGYFEKENDLTLASDDSHINTILKRIILEEQ